MGFRVQGSGSGVGFGVSGFGLRDKVFGFRVKGKGFEVWGVCSRYLEIEIEDRGRMFQGKGCRA